MPRQNCSLGALPDRLVYRLTQDVDLTLLTELGNEEDFVDSLLTVFLPRRTDCREFALSRRVLLIQTSQGVGVDAALGALPFEERTVGRASAWAWAPGQSLTTCSAEDLVVHKVCDAPGNVCGSKPGLTCGQHRQKLRRNLSSSTTIKP